MTAHTPHRRRILAAIAAAASAALLLTACSGGAGGTAGAGGATALEPGDPTAPEVTAVKLAGIKSPGLIPLHYASTTVAPEFGLTMEPVYVDNSGVSVTSVISGDVQAANSSFFGVIDAINQGLDIVVIAEGWASTPDTGSLEALPSSGISSLEDLEGKTVNVISLNSSHAVKLRATMLKEGLDPDAVNWVELPYGEVPAALEQGTVDASSATGAALQAVRKLGSVTVFDYADDGYEGMAESGWIASRQWVEQNPNTTAAIQCTLFRAQGAIMDDRALFDEQFVEMLGAPLEAAQADVRLNYLTENRVDAIQRNAEVYEAAGRLTEPFDFSAHVVPAPAEC